MPDFPRFWGLLAFLLPASVRRQSFDPSLEELKGDFLVARRRYRTKRAGAWLTFCFTIRTAILVIQSLRAWIGDRGMKLLGRAAVVLLGREAVRFLVWLFRSSWRL